jgi:hypothetical protein
LTLTLPSTRTTETGLTDSRKPDALGNGYDHEGANGESWCSEATVRLL